MLKEIMINKEQKVSQATLDALGSELLKNLHPQYPRKAIRIRKGSADGIELSGLRVDEDKKILWTLSSQYGKTKAGSIDRVLFINPYQICKMA